MRTSRVIATPREPQVADLLARQPDELVLQLVPPVPHHEPATGNGVDRVEHGRPRARATVRSRRRPRRRAGRTTCRPRSSRCMISISFFTSSSASAGTYIGRRLHLHHPPAGDVHRQRRDVVQVGVRDEPRRRAHEVPRAARRGRSRSSVPGCASSSAPRRATSPRSVSPPWTCDSTGRCRPAGRGP